MVLPMEHGALCATSTLGAASALALSKQVRFNHRPAATRGS